jgi:hypothetical protein
MIESCESGCFSYYLNVDGVGFPCSFCEGEVRDNLDLRGVNLLEIKDFNKEVWNNENIVKFRNQLINNKTDGCRICPVFKLEG